MHKKKSLIVIAPGACKEDVGEVFLAYKWIEVLSKTFDITLLTLDLKTKHHIADNDLPIKIIRFEDKGMFSGFERLNSMMKPWYVSFFKDCRKWLIDNVVTGDVNCDWVHQFNPFAMRFPCPAVGLDLKYSIGPVAGGLKNIDSFKTEMGGVPFYTKFRNFDDLFGRYAPYLKKSYNGADFILAAAPYVETIINERFDRSNDITVINEHGVDVVTPAERRFDSPQLKLLYVGRVVRSKGLRDLIRSFKYLDQSKFTLQVIGSGDDLENCIQEAKDNNFSNIVFHGKLNRDEVDGYYKSSDLMVFPSFREPTGGVVIEAMSFGLPQIVCDLGGPGSIINDDIGLKLQVTNPSQFPRDIAKAIMSLDSNRKMLIEYQSNSLSFCTDNYLWPNKVGQFAELLLDRIGR